MPRHNVRQYMGNAVWGASGAIDFQGGLAAMLGDPFQYTKSPNMAALIHLIQGREGDDLERALSSSFKLEERYTGVDWSRDTRDRFLSFARTLRRSRLTHSALWGSLPGPLRAELEATQPDAVPTELAMCIAVRLQDMDFSQRAAQDVWLEELMPDGSPGDVHLAYQDGHDSMSGFWAGSEVDAMDPRGVVYTSVYQSHASGWYGGNVTTVFAPTDVPWGSGMDRQWIEAGCAGPVPRTQRGDDENWRRQFCDRHRVAWASESSSANADAGELRSPGYKTPAEVDGLLVYDWKGSSQEALDELGRWHDDLSGIAPPLQWAFYRAKPEHRHSLVLVLAPVALSEPVYGLEATGDPQSFHASPPPPQLGGDLVAVASQHVAFRMADLPTPSMRRVPVWGVLYPCSQANERLEPLQPTADDDIRRCAAVARLRQHNATLDGVTRAARDQTVMPSELRAQVHTMHIWPADAVVDLEDGGGSVTTTRPRDRVCMVSVAGATEADGCVSPMG